MYLAAPLCLDRSTMELDASGAYRVCRLCEPEEIFRMERAVRCAFAQDCSIEEFVQQAAAQMHPGATTCVDRRVNIRRLELHESLVQEVLAQLS